MTILEFGTSIINFPIADGLTGGSSSAKQSPHTNEANLQSTSFADMDIALVAISDFWLTFYVYIETEGTLANIRWKNGADLLGRIRISDAGQGARWLLQTHNGAGYTTVAQTEVVISDVTRVRIDLHVVLNDTTGLIKLYQDFIPYASFTGDTITNGVISTVDTITFDSSVGSGSDNYYSGWMIADEPTFDFIMHQPLPNGAGANADWDGLFTAVDGAGFNTGSRIKSTTANDKVTYTFNTDNTTFGSGFTVGTVKLFVSALHSQTGLENLKAITRLSAVDFITGAEATTLSYDSYEFEWVVNPDTTNPWTWAELHGAEFGVQATA